MKLRHDLPFRRIAVVLSGGGAYGAYEAGVLRTLNAAGLEPAIIAGVSVGALNAVAWVAHAGDTTPLERTWSGLRPERLGIRWAMLGLRGAGGFLVVLGAVEALLVLAGYPVNVIAERFSSLRQLGGYLRATDALEFLTWALLATVGVLFINFAPRLDDALSRGTFSASPELVERTLGVLVLASGALYAVVATLGLPWPLRLHFVAWAIALLAWIVLRSAPLRTGIGRLWLRLTPETGGRGLWRNSARRRLIHGLCASGDASRLVRGPVQIIVSACDVATGILTYFTNREPEADLLGRVGPPLAEVVVLSTPTEVMDAAVASSVVPVLYEPFAFHGRRYIDAGLFANQPLHAIVATGADAMLLVIVSPSSGLRPESEESNLVEIAGRLSEIANWRDLQTELLQLPPEFSREGQPARVCVVEPDAPLAGGLFEFDADHAVAFMEQGARDAETALVRAGWLAR